MFSGQENNFKFQSDEHYEKGVAVILTLVFGALFCSQN